MNRRAWMVTSLLVVFQIINFADKAVLGLVADSAIKELGLTAGQFGLIGSAFFFLFAIAAVAVGFLAGKVSTRWILLTMGISWAVLQFPMLFGAAPRSFWSPASCSAGPRARQPPFPCSTSTAGSRPRSAASPPASLPLAPRSDPSSRPPFWPASSRTRHSAGVGPSGSWA